MKKVYSYSRVSSIQQTKDGKHGLDRQKDSAEAYAIKFGYQLVELIDAGVSGFKLDKNNISHGELGRFIQAIQNGDIERGSILLIENLDRLGRHGISKTQMIVGNIISGGIEIHVWNGGDRVDIYSEETMNEIGSAVMLAVHADGAYKQSKDKSDRHTNNWAKKREKTLKDGSLLTRHVPKWMKVLEDDSIIIPVENQDLIDSIVTMYLDDNLGMNAIVGKLKKEGVKSFFPSYNIGSFNLMLRSRTLIGELEFKKTGEVIKDYYPAAMDEDTFNRIQLKAKERGNKFRRTGGNAHNTKNLFRNICKCGYCGSSVNLKSISTKGVKHGFLRCNNLTCKKGGWNIKSFEPTFFKLVKSIDLDLIFSGTGEAKKITNKIEALKGKLSLLDDQITKLTKLAMLTDDIEQVAAQINSIKLDKSGIKEQIEVEENNLQTQSVTNTKIVHDVENMTEEQRLNLRNHLQTLISKIELFTVPHKTGNEGKNFKINWINGRITHVAFKGDETLILIDEKDVEGLSDKDLRALYGSDVMLVMGSMVTD